MVTPLMVYNEKETSIKMDLHVVCWRGFFHGDNRSYKQELTILHLPVIFIQ